MRLSYSALDTFNTCPLKYKFRYIDKIPSKVKPELFFGDLIHQIVQEALRRDPAVVPLDELLQLYKRRWKKEPFRTEQEEKAYLSLGENMLRVFHQSHKPGLRNIVALEKSFRLPFGDHTITGRIDRIDQLPHGPFEVIDYKTNKNLPDKSQIERNLQLGIYHLATLHSWPDVSEVHLTLYFLKFNAQMTVRASRDLLEEVTENLTAGIRKIEEAVQTGNFPAKVGSHCSWCDYQEICPEWSHKFKKKPDADIAKKVAEYIEAKGKADALEPEIHKHFDKEKIERYFHPKGVVARRRKGFVIKEPEA